MNLAQTSAHVKIIPKGEFRERLSEMCPKLSRPEIFERAKTFYDASGDIFILIEHESWGKLFPRGPGPEDETARAFISLLQRAASRMRDVISWETMPLFPISFRSRGCEFDTLGPHVRIHAALLRLLDEFSAHPDIGLLTRQVEAGFFHELVHRVQYEANDEPHEITSLMGEFLYDPAGNKRLNDTKFRDLSLEVRDLALSGIEPKSRHYAHSWRVAARLLLAESHGLGSLTIPDSAEGQLNALENLPKAFSDTSQKQRDGLLSRHILLLQERLEALSMEACERVGLRF
ncbi:MAG: hypothetical protein V1827_03115 [Candidatus Micrarchaeota archaeon]